jgi:hypothetical protein
MAVTPASCPIAGVGNAARLLRRVRLFGAELVEERRAERRELGPPPGRDLEDRGSVAGCEPRARKDARDRRLEAVGGCHVMRLAQHEGELEDERVAQSDAREVHGNYAWPVAATIAQ